MVSIFLRGQGSLFPFCGLRIIFVRQALMPRSSPNGPRAWTQTRRTQGTASRTYLLSESIGRRKLTSTASPPLRSSSRKCGTELEQLRRACPGRADLGRTASKRRRTLCQHRKSTSPPTSLTLAMAGRGSYTEEVRDAMQMVGYG